MNHFMDDQFLYKMKFFIFKQKKLKTPISVND